MPLYNPESIWGKTLFSIKTVKAHLAADKESDVLFTFKPGATVGIVNRDIPKTDGIWWQFKRAGGTNFYYVKHDEGLFSLKALKEQGLQTEAEKAEAEAEANKTILDKIFDFGKKSATGIIIVLLAVYAYNKTQSKK